MLYFRQLCTKSRYYIQRIPIHITNLTTVTIINVLDLAVIYRIVNVMKNNLSDEKHDTGSCYIMYLQHLQPRINSQPITHIWLISKVVTTFSTMVTNNTSGC